MPFTLERMKDETDENLAVARAREMRKKRHLILDEIVWMDVSGWGEV